jgi:hypothetical protein
VNVCSAGPIAIGVRAWFHFGASHRGRHHSGRNGWARFAQRYTGAVNFARSGWNFATRKPFSSAKYRLARRAHGNQTEEW